jgi:hypothetical protein
MRCGSTVHVIEEPRVGGCASGEARAVLPYQSFATTRFRASRLRRLGNDNLEIGKGEVYETHS